MQAVERCLRADTQYRYRQAQKAVQHYSEQHQQSQWKAAQNCWRRAPLRREELLHEYINNEESLETRAAAHQRGVGRHSDAPSSDGSGAPRVFRAIHVFVARLFWFAAEPGGTEAPGGAELGVTGAPG